jgi:hypothetical protein
MSSAGLALELKRRARRRRVMQEERQAVADPTYRRLSKHHKDGYTRHIRPCLDELRDMLPYMRRKLWRSYAFDLSSSPYSDPRISTPYLLTALTAQHIQPTGPVRNPSVPEQPWTLHDQRMLSKRLFSAKGRARIYADWKLCSMDCVPLKVLHCNRCRQPRLVDGRYPGADGDPGFVCEHDAQFDSRFTCQDEAQELPHTDKCWELTESKAGELFSVCSGPPEERTVHYTHWPEANAQLATQEELLCAHRDWVFFRLPDTEDMERSVHA